MVKTNPAPTSLARRQLGAVLRRARDRKKLDLKDVAAAMGLGLGWSISKLGRIERGETGRLTLPEVEKLAKILELSDEELSNLIGLLRQAASKSKWYPYRDLLPGNDFRVYLDLESAAERLIMFHNNIIPGLLQTTAYAGALDRTYFPNDSDVDLDRRCQLKAERQALITRRHNPVEVTAILHEAVVHTLVGNRTVMDSQIAHLAEISKRPNISLRVLPFSAGLPLGTASGSFTIIDLKANAEGEQSPVVYLESLTGAVCLDEPDEVDEHRVAATVIQRAALDEVSTRTLLRQASKKG
ncbi:helix-turn-helix domain-containing protein [Nocardia sp. NBC_00511]|uniref:helix-turn-helix domain-containing protein n=1 Tax=Nocardia sp. NBC_00511 TaxID=2903591 RepID=UPI0030E4B998